MDNTQVLDNTIRSKDSAFNKIVVPTINNCSSHTIRKNSAIAALAPVSRDDDKNKAADSIDKKDDNNTEDSMANSQSPSS